MKTIQTENGKQTIIMQKGDYTLLATYYRATGEFHEYVAAWLYKPNGSWGQGHYCDSLESAINCFRKKTDPNYIPRERLEELATKALHGLVDENVYDIYESDLALESNEIEYFGIEIKKEDDYEFDDIDLDDGEPLMDDDELFDFIMGHLG